MSDLRRRKAPTHPTIHKASTKQQTPSILTRLTTTIPPSILFTALLLLLIYLLDPVQHLPPLLSGRHPATLRLTDAQLLAHDGRDPSIPLLLAVNGTIYDVSAGRHFYGPGGMYAHFAGRDATRAWVTACFGEEQWTWDLRGVEEMFVPVWLDERLENVIEGRTEATDVVREHARKTVEKVGRVSEEEKQRRRVQDQEEARRKVDEALKHWVDFFGKSKKYREIGKVVGRGNWEEMIKPPGLCEEALKKRPMKGGKLEGVMGKMMEQLGMGKDAGKGMPDFVKPKVGDAST